MRRGAAAGAAARSACAAAPHHPSLASPVCLLLACSSAHACLINIPEQLLLERAAQRRCNQPPLARMPPPRRPCAWIDAPSRPALQIPKFNRQTLDVHRLYNLVQARGGYDEVGPPGPG